MSILHVVSMSGGKDPTACALLALKTHEREECRFVFVDTGNEHPLVYEYLDYLEGALDIEIVHLKRDFTDWWWRRRDYVRDVWPEKLVKKYGATPDVAAAIVARVLAVYEKGPTGNPYLDLCIIKGRFPSRRAQFCTEELKTIPLTEYAMGLIDQGHTVWSWQGVRAEESPHRAKAIEFEEVGGGLFNFRPIKHWTVAQVFEAHRANGVEPNPLYKLGMSRVGCMPCINAAKGEIAEISRRFPKEVERIAEWERVVGEACRRGFSTFFAKGPGDSPGDIGFEQVYDIANINQIVRWAQTTRGGKQFDLLAASEELPVCSSAYGLCE